MSPSCDHHFLRIAARLAVRGHGGAEPNPLVGCVLVDGRGSIVAEACHRRCGGPHAEVRALDRAGTRARGATAYVTLEPCSHQGRTGACTEALIGAGIGRVVYGRRDPHPQAGGGAERLRAAGIAADLVATCPEARAVSDPFVHRLRTGRPWVIAKWAQTVDGRIATRTGESRWISGPPARRLVHRERGRVDVIMTGIGTVLRDDPRLTARGVRRRRTARRVVVDAGLRTPADATVVNTPGDAPITIFCAASVLVDAPARRDALAAHGAEVIGVPGTERTLPLDEILRELSRRHDAATVLVEAGAGLLGSLFDADLVNEAWVFVAPLALGDETAVPALRGRHVERLSEGIPLHLKHVHRRGADVLLRYGRGGTGDA